jgi:hypothetical protein
METPHRPAEQQADTSGAQGIASGCRVNGTTQPTTVAQTKTIAPQV